VFNFGIDDVDVGFCFSIDPDVSSSLFLGTVTYIDIHIDDDPGQHSAVDMSV
jgi:hypothetical protein